LDSKTEARRFTFTKRDYENDLAAIIIENEKIKVWNGNTYTVPTLEYLWV
jgi:hypothetical protein